MQISNLSVFLGVFHFSSLICRLVLFVSLWFVSPATQITFQKLTTVPHFIMWNCCWQLELQFCNYLWGLRQKLTLLICWEINTRVKCCSTVQKSRVTPHPFVFLEFLSHSSPGLVPDHFQRNLFLFANTCLWIIQTLIRHLTQGLSQCCVYT